jgi:hypothetical protein
VADHAVTRLLGRIIPCWVWWAAAAALLAAVYGVGRLHQAQADAAAQADTDRARFAADVARLARRAEIAQRVSRAYELDVARNRKHQTAIETEVRHAVETRVLYRDCVLDADVVRHLNAALAGAPEGRAPGEPPDPVP